jgi:beta-xylosidase
MINEIRQCVFPSIPQLATDSGDIVRKYLIFMAMACGLATAASTRQEPAFVPAFRTDFPDPFVLPWGGGYFAYATNAKGLAANVQMAVSRDLKSWTPVTADAGGKRRLHDAMPELPKWAAPGRTWAPEVLRLGDRYILYFTAMERKSGLQCVGVAVAAKDPRGPFIPQGNAPLVCQRDKGGTIDANAFRDADGSLWLLYKSDGNNPRFLLPSRIYVQRLSGDGIRLEGEATELIRNDQHWEWRVVESPTMLRDPQGRYVLLFSANHFGWESDQRLSNYAMGYARCESVTGPCVKAKENPILKSYYSADKGCLSGPGHQTVFEANGRQHIVFHAWAATPKCRKAEDSRFMYVAPLEWREGTPTVGRSLR